MRPPPAESVEDKLLRLFPCRLGKHMMDKSPRFAWSEVGRSIWIDNALKNTSIDCDDELWNSSLWNSSFMRMSPSMSTSSESDPTPTSSPRSVDLIDLLLRQVRHVLHGYFFSVHPLLVEYETWNVIRKSKSCR